MIEFGDWDSKEKEVIAKNKCGGGIDLFITYVCREKKKEKKKKKKYCIRQEKRKKSVD